MFSFNVVVVGIFHVFMKGSWFFAPVFSPIHQMHTCDCTPCFFHEEQFLFTVSSDLLAKLEMPQMASAMSLPRFLSEVLVVPKFLMSPRTL